MPWAPPHPCTAPGCGALVRNGPRCERHARQQRRDLESRRGTSSQRGYGARWQAARLAYLRRHPLCVACHARGRIVQASVVDHIRPHNGDQSLFWDQGNWQALCKACHDRKTATSDGRWG